MADHRDDQHTRQQADDRLLAQLRAVARQVDPVPDELKLAARSQLAYLRLDAELAELTFDSSTEPEPVGVRSETQVTRRLTFEAGTTQVEIEVVAEGDRRRLVGQCLPATQVEVTVRSRSSIGDAGDDQGTRTISTDDLGRFNVEVPSGTVSLRCEWPHAELAVETAWVSV
jgi:hypothetical protein